MKNEQKCEETIRTYYSAIYRYCLKLLRGDVEAAEDCTQTVFLLLHEKRNELDFGSRIKSWLFVVAERTARDFLAREQRRKAVIAGNIDDMENSFTDPWRDAEETVLDCLTEEEYRLADAYYSAAYGSRKQLAEQLGMSLAQLYKKVFDIREKLRNAAEVQSESQGDFYEKSED